jgi:hypothetical protein
MSIRPTQKESPLNNSSRSLQLKLFRQPFVS